MGSVLVAASAVLSACATERTAGIGPEGTRSLQTPNERSVDALPSTIRAEEGAFAALAAKVPSSAGYYIAADGSTVLLVRDTADASRARQAFDAVKPANHRHFVRSTGIRIVKAQYSFGQLATWRDAIAENAGEGMVGIRSLDLDEVRNRVVVGIDRRAVESTTANVRRFLTQVNIDAQAVFVEPVDEVVLAAGAERHASSARKLGALMTSGRLLGHQWPALAGGVLILTSATPSQTPAAGGQGPCSIGFTAQYTPSSGASYRAVVTATHCTAVWGAPDNTTFAQNFLSVAGTATVDPHKYNCSGNWCRASDAAMFQLAPEMPSELGLIVRTTFNSTTTAIGSVEQDTQSPWFVITSATTGSIPVGATYHKMGWVGGWTTGYRYQSCVDLWLGNWPDAFVTRCADRGTAENQPGDSGGSVFVRLDSNNVSLIGTTVGNIGGDHVYSPYSRVASDMGGTMVVTRPATLTEPVLTSSLVGGHANVTWPGVSGASEYQVFVQEVWQQCDEYWGCSLTYGPETKYTVTGTTWQDSRNTFIAAYVDPNGPHMRVRVKANNPLGASFSTFSPHVLFSLP